MVQRKFVCEATSTDTLSVRPSIVTVSLLGALAPRRSCFHNIVPIRIFLMSWTFFMLRTMRMQSINELCTRHIMYMDSWHIFHTCVFTRWWFTLVHFGPETQPHSTYRMSGGFFLSVFLRKYNMYDNDKYILHIFIIHNIPFFWKNLIHNTAPCVHINHNVW